MFCLEFLYCGDVLGLRREVIVIKLSIDIKKKRDFSRWYRSSLEVGSVDRRGFLILKNIIVG